MTTPIGKLQCVVCGKEKGAISCEGCSQPFCYNHFGEHRQTFNPDLKEIDETCEQFQQTLTKLTTKLQKHPLFQQIDQWERDSITKIQQTAEEARHILLKYLPPHITTAAENLNKFTNQIRKSRKDNDFFETDIQQWKEQLTMLKEKLRAPANILIEPTWIPLVTKISVNVFVPTYMLNIDINAKWLQQGVIVAGGNVKGKGLNQLNSPSGLYVDYNDQTIYVTDHCNHRIMAWKDEAKSGCIVAGGNKSGNRNNQLYNPIDVIVDKENDSLLICDGGNRRVVRWPRQNGTQGQTIIPDISCYGLTMDDNGYLYVSDSVKHEVKQWKIGDTHGTVVAGGNGEGDQLDQLSCPTFIFVGHDHSLYISDYNNHRVMKWINGAKEGVVVAGGQGKGYGLAQLSNPGGIAVDQLGTVYVADYDNHRIMRWLKGATKGSIVVNGNSSENDANQLFNPSGLSLDRWGNLYIANCDRVQKFNIDLNSNI